MGSLTPLARASKLVQRPGAVLPAPRRQFTLVFDNIRLQDLTAAQRQTVIQTVAQLLIEASGAVMVEAGDDDA